MTCVRLNQFELVGCETGNDAMVQTRACEEGFPVCEEAMVEGHEEKTGMSLDETNQRGRKGKSSDKWARPILTHHVTGLKFGGKIRPYHALKVSKRCRCQVAG